MQKISFIAIIITILMASSTVWAVDQDTIDRMVFILHQHDWDYWSDQPFGDDLIEGLEIIYDQAITDEDDQLRAKVIWAMGETGLVEFIPTIIEDLELDPTIACYALGKIPSEDGVYALFEMLDDEDMFVRDAAVWGLGNIPYTDSMEEVRNDVIATLYERLEDEEEDWIIENIDAAIVLLETGMVTDPAFDTDEATHF